MKSVKEHGRRRHRRHSRRRYTSAKNLKVSVDPNQLTDHHKVSRRHCKRGAPQPDNIARIPRWRHQAWHTLFHDMTPFEIVRWIIKTKFPTGSILSAVIRARWQSKKHSFLYDPCMLQHATWTMNRAQRKAWKQLFGERDSYSVLDELLTYSEWAPSGYFTEVHVVVRDGGAITLDFG